MRLKDLLSVPAGKKVTEKQLYRVLISSVCSILLCMSCLAGTTWAWFTVSLENTENIIEIGKPTVQVDTAAGEVVFVSGETMPAGAYSLRVWNTNTADDFNKKATTIQKTALFSSCRYIYRRFLTSFYLFRTFYLTERQLLCIMV